ncbi:MAG: hypothetical protein BGN88_01890 [Clostridiales bacterium 43-6]|nr:MAG: hypothetical protein BGN88_01890 [Clostridiales bacterium 43-6]
MKKGIDKKGFRMAVLAVCMAATVSGCAKPAGKLDESKKYGDTYPITSEKTLTVWDGNSSVYPDYKSYTEQPYYQELQKRTGIKIEFTFPTAGQHKEAFNLLLSSNKLPDIIQYDWLLLPGGPEKYIKDKYIIELNSAVEKYAPNLKAYLEKNPQQDKAVKTDSNKYYCFPQLQGPDYPGVYIGPLVRTDWLDELGLAEPETIDDWYTMLKAFKEKKGSTGIAYSDFHFVWTGAFSGAYGVIKDFYLEDGKVKYGPIEPGYKEFLTTFRKWYQEGLINKDIATMDTQLIAKLLTSEKTGTVIGTTGSLNQWMPSLKKGNPKAELAGVKYPVLNKGEKPKFGHKDWAYKGLGAAAITTQCKDVELAVKFLDYSYSDEGRMFKNFGVEGVTYQMVDGQPKFTDEIMKNFDSIFKWTNDYQSILDARKFNQRMSSPIQQAAIKTWSDTEILKYKMPLVTATAEESQEISNLMNQIQTYMDETTLKFIFGNEDISKFDEYVATIKKLGIDKVIEMKTKAVERFNSRQ